MNNLSWSENLQNLRLDINELGVYTTRLTVSITLERIGSPSLQQSETLTCYRM